MITVRSALALTVGVLAIVSLSACAPEEGSVPAPSASSSPSSSPSGSPAGSPSASPSVGPSASVVPSSTPTATAAPQKPAQKPTPVNIDCDVLLPPQAVYDYNPNFGLLGPFTPDAGTPAALALADSGVACRWVNQTSGIPIDVSVSKPTASDLAARKSAASSGQRVSGVGDAAYFSLSGGIGQVQVFSGTNWLTVRSAQFAAADEAHGLVTAAVAALPR